MGLLVSIIFAIGASTARKCHVATVSDMAVWFALVTLLFVAVVSLPTSMLSHCVVCNELKFNVFVINEFSLSSSVQ